MLITRLSSSGSTSSNIYCVSLIEKVLENFPQKLWNLTFWNLSEHIIKKNRLFFGAQFHTSKIQRARRGKRALNRYHDWFILMAFFFAIRSCFIVGKFYDWFFSLYFFVCVFLFMDQAISRDVNAQSRRSKGQSCIRQQKKF